MEEVPIIDALAATENLLHWTRLFAPLSGLETELDHPWERYLLAYFCYGCNLGPSQTGGACKLEMPGLAKLREKYSS
jgi:hypothetical protein